MGPVSGAERKEIIQKSPFAGKYGKEDEPGTYESPRNGQPNKPANDPDHEWAGEFRIPKKPGASELPPPPPPPSARRQGGSRRQTYGEAFGKSLARALGTAAGRLIDRILGTSARK